MVRILVAPDKFKGSLTAQEVCENINEVLSPRADSSVTMLPLADGGDGTFEILMKHFDAVVHEAEVHDPLMRKIQATFALSRDGKTAFIEMAKASGLQLLKSNEQDPLKTTSFGTGELIIAGLKKNVTSIVLGIGGSATNDAVIGMASALGYRFFDASKKEIKNLNGESLSRITTIDISNVIPLLASVAITTLCDVTNPFTGTNGAANVFAPQKGATADDVRRLEQGMIHFENLLLSAHGFSTGFAGAGAAGGLGAGARFFLNAKLRKGMDFISEATSLEEAIKASDIVITGEGKLDLQTVSGKVVQHVAGLAKKHDKKVIAVCGILELDPGQLRVMGIDECLALSTNKNDQYSITNAAQLLKHQLMKSKILACR